MNGAVNGGTGDVVADGVVAGGVRRWGRVVVGAVAVVGWAFAGMTAVATLGVALLDTDRRTAFGPSAAALVTLAVGGRVRPSGELWVFGAGHVTATGALDLRPLGVTLTGVLLAGGVFVRLARGAGGAELAVRAGCVVALFTAATAGLAWAGRDTVTLRGSASAARLPGTGGLPGGLAGLDGGFAHGLDALDHAGATVGFRADPGASAAGGALWIAAVLALACLASRRAPGPFRHGTPAALVRPAVSAWCSVLLMTVVAGLAVAVAAALGDAHPARVLGGALLGAPNGVWFALTLGLFVPWRGVASGPLAVLLPDPVGRVLGDSAGPVTLPRLAAVDGRVWLLPVAAALAVLAAGVLTALRAGDGAALRTGDGGAGRTGDGGAPGGRDGTTSRGRDGTVLGRRDGTAPRGRDGTVLRRRDGGDRAGRRLLRTAVLTGAAGAVAVPTLVALTGFSAGAGLSAFGVDAVGAAVSLRGGAGWGALLGAAWGAAGGAAGAAAVGWARSRRG